MRPNGTYVATVDQQGPLTTSSPGPLLVVSTSNLDTYVEIVRAWISPIREATTHANIDAWMNVSISTVMGVATGTAATVTNLQGGGDATPVATAIYDVTSGAPSIQGGSEFDTVHCQNGWVHQPLPDERLRSGYANYDLGSGPDAATGFELDMTNWTSVSHPAIIDLELSCGIVWNEFGG